MNIEAAPISADVAVHMIKQRERVTVPTWTTAVQVLKDLDLTSNEIIRVLCFGLSGELVQHQE